MPLNTSPKCHVGTPEVFTDPATGQKWFAGGTSRGFVAPKDSVTVALTSYAMDMPILANIPLVPMQRQMVYINWPDGAAGPIKTLNDWKGLLRALRATKQNVAIACMGGHGRTGTFLAINAWLMELTQTPIEYIRKIYCDECVETQAQFDLVKKITGVDEIKLKPANYSSGAWTGGYGVSGYGSYQGYGAWQGSDKKPKHFGHNVNPDDECAKLGWFWGKVYGTSITEYHGSPAGAGKWTTDSAGWYWEWDKDNKNPEYYKTEVKGGAASDYLDEEFDEVINQGHVSDDGAGTFDPDSGYGYPDKPTSAVKAETPDRKGVDAKQFLNDYYSGKKNQSA